ncbi:hypothetical protein Q9233_007814 [Columba guinea]|nr:hypothetical protein Q9233_007814 [Columba guinea]
MALQEKYWPLLFLCLLIATYQDECNSQAVSYINVGVFHVLDEAGVEVHCGGHPSVELPGYSPMDPELNASYPYCYPLPSEQPPAYEEIYPAEHCAHGT